MCQHSIPAGDTGRDRTEEAPVSQSLHFVDERQTQASKQIREIRDVKSTVNQTNGDVRESGWRSFRRSGQGEPL